MKRNRRGERLIEKLYETVFRIIYSDKNLKAIVKDPRKAKELMDKVEKNSTYKKFCRKYARQLAKLSVNAQQSVWKRLYKEAKDNHYVGLPSNYSEFEKNAFQKAVISNFKMIKSIPAEILKPLEYDYSKKLIAEVLEGKTSIGSFRKTLTEGGHKNAKLIARTESAKLMTAVTEEHCSDLGCVIYKWSASHDQRTRKSHKDMDGVIVFWRKGDEKPHLDKMVGNAGEFPNCRCDPMPMTLRSLDRLYNKSVYRVYDYRKHEIVKMNKADLVAAIKKGGL